MAPHLREDIKLYCVEKIYETKGIKLRKLYSNVCRLYKTKNFRLSPHRLVALLRELRVKDVIFYDKKTKEWRPKGKRGNQCLQLRKVCA